MRLLAATATAVALCWGVASAQTSTTGPTGSSATMKGTSVPSASGVQTTTPMAPAPGALGSPGVSAGVSQPPLAGTAARTSPATPGTGDANQAAFTTGASAAMPAKGRNSFTVTQARSRIQARGYAQVAGLKKDADGVWRGQGQKDGAPVSVWMDYRGNVGQQ